MAKVAFCFAAFLSLGFCEAHHINREDQDFPQLSNLLANLVSLDNTELVFISDFTLSKQDDTLRELVLKGVQTRTYDINHLEMRQKAKEGMEKCPMFSIPSDSGGHHRRRKRSPQMSHGGHHAKAPKPEPEITNPSENMHNFLNSFRKNEPPHDWYGKPTQPPMKQEVPTADVSDAHKPHNMNGSKGNTTTPDQNRNILPINMVHSHGHLSKKTTIATQMATGAHNAHKSGGGQHGLGMSTDPNAHNRIDNATNAHTMENKNEAKVQSHQDSVFNNMHTMHAPKSNNFSSLLTSFTNNQPQDNWYGNGPLKPADNSHSSHSGNMKPGNGLTKKPGTMVHSGHGSKKTTTTTDQDGNSFAKNMGSSHGHLPKETSVAPQIASSAHNAHNSRGGNDPNQQHQNIGTIGKIPEGHAHNEHTMENKNEAKVESHQDSVSNNIHTMHAPPSKSFSSFLTSYTDNQPQDNWYGNGPLKPAGNPHSSHGSMKPGNGDTKKPGTMAHSGHGANNAHQKPPNNAHNSHNNKTPTSHNAVHNMHGSQNKSPNTGGNAHNMHGSQKASTDVEGGHGGHGVQSGHGSHDNGAPDAHNNAHNSHNAHHMKDDSQFFVPPQEIYIREQFIPLNKYFPTYVIWTKDLDQIFKVFDGTIIDCQQRVDLGIFKQESRFVFIVDQENVMNGTRPEDVLVLSNNLNVQRHKQTAVVQRKLKSPDSMVTYQIYTKDMVNSKPKIVLRNTWTSKNPLKTIKDAFWDDCQFNGHQLKVGANLWSHHVLADSIAPTDKEWSPTNQFKNYWGFEIDLLDDLAGALNFTYVIENPPVPSWGRLRGDGTWDGLLNLTMENKIDLAISNVHIMYARTQVIEPLIPFDFDYLALTAPLPQLLPKLLAIVYPFDKITWIAISISLPLVSIVFYMISIRESDIIREPLSDWSNIPASIWYAYGILMGKPMAEDRKSQHASSLRWILAIWMLYCMIIAYAYGGSLKAWLTYPGKSVPINTLSDILESNLPWRMVISGQQEETIMAESKDPTIQKVWLGKEVAEYSANSRIEGAYLGQEVFLDFKSGMEAAAFVKFSSMTGDPLVHISPVPVLMKHQVGWAFNKYNPWRPAFDRVARRVIEAGLVDHHKATTLARMRQNYLASDEEKLEYKRRPDISPLSLDDLQGACYLLLLGFILSAAAFLSEICCGAIKYLKFLQVLKTKEQDIVQNIACPGVKIKTPMPVKESKTFLPDLMKNSLKITK